MLCVPSKCSCVAVVVLISLYCILLRVATLCYHTFDFERWLRLLQQQRMDMVCDDDSWMRWKLKLSSLDSDIPHENYFTTALFYYINPFCWTVATFQPKWCPATLTHTHQQQCELNSANRRHCSTPVFCFMAREAATRKINWQLASSTLFWAKEEWQPAFFVDTKLRCCCKWENV